MYNNSTHYPNTAYQSAYPQYQQNYGTTYGYQDYGTQYDQNRTNPQPAPPGEVFPSENNWSVAPSYGTPQDG